MSTSTKRAKGKAKADAGQIPTAWRNRIVGSGLEDAEQLLANPRNWRVHPKAQQDALEGVLREVGWVQNVIVNQRTGYVVDGHARVAMAISRGEKVPVVYVDLDEREEALVLATLDPLAAMAGTDQEKLAELVGNLSVDDEAVKALLESVSPPGLRQGLTDADAVPSIPDVATTQPGDLWLCGAHRLLCGDAEAAADVGRLLGGTAPLLMVTDPPYGVDYDPEWRAPINWDPKRTAVGTVNNDDNSDWTKAYSLFHGDVAYVWHAGIFAGQVDAGLRAASFEIRAQIIWKKQHFVFGRGAYHWGHEPCWYAVRKSRPGNWHGDRKQSTVWEVANLNPMGGNKEEQPTGHGTQKPVELMRRPILNHTLAGEAVYDPFLGSGTTMMACEQLGRICFGIDIDPKYVDVAVRRWQNFTGQKATLDGDGRTFEELVSVRFGMRLGGQDAIAEEVLRS